MRIEDAISVLSDELDHIRHHLTAKGKAPEYYEELGQLATAVEMGIEALRRRPATETDYISREAALTAIQHLFPCVPLVTINLREWQEKEAPYLESMKAIERIPSADVRPVVYCKDCTYCHYDMAGNIGCFHYRNYGTPGAEVKPYDYCSYAKRRTGQEDDRCYYERHNCGAKMGGADG